jgi:tetratricopeptide (TPR) repeat protein
MDRRTSQENLGELIDSGQFLAAEEIFSERRTDEPFEMLIRAEVAIYFDRLDDAGNLLEQVAPRIVEVGVAARYALTKGRLALIRGRDEEADSQLQSAFHFYSFHNDSFGIARSLLALATLQRQRGQLSDAEAKLKTAIELIAGRPTKRSDYLRSIILTEHAHLSVDLGDIERATELYAEAAPALRTVEKGKFYAYALIGQADLKCELGDYQESLDLYKEANLVFERYDLKRDSALCLLKTARALIKLKRFERAERLAQDSLNMRRGNPADEAAALSVLTVLALNQNNLEDAVVRARSAVDLADRSERVEARAFARTALGHVRLAEREFKEAAEVLGRAAEIARGLPASTENRRLELEAVIYQAEALHNIDTRAGRAELARANELLNNLEDAWLGDEYNRVSAKYEEQIVFTDDNRLVFDGNQLPRWQEAKRTLEGFLLRNALRQTNNSLTRAARKLGVSKVHVHNLKKKHNL